MSQGERLAILVPRDLGAWVSVDFAGEGDTAVEGGGELVGVPACDLWWDWMRAEMRAYLHWEHKTGVRVGETHQGTGLSSQSHPWVSPHSPWRASFTSQSYFVQEHRVA